MILLFLAGFQVNAQNLFRSGIFLHHSTGNCIWGPNGSSTSVPQEMEAYNIAHGYYGQQAVTMNEEWWAPDDNEWITQHAFFEDPSPITGIGYYLPGNKIIVIKSCFPSSAISYPGVPEDTLYPDMKTVYNYKWHWRHIINVMKSHPDNFFVIWTNAPLEPNSTNVEEATLADSFCTWAKDTLAMGLDPEFGSFPRNVYVFDYFHKLTGPDGMELPMYAAGAGDSHPNAMATAFVAPQFVEEIFNASVAYETLYGIPVINDPYELFITATPNPFTTEMEIKFITSGKYIAKLALFDASGKQLEMIWRGREKGEHRIYFSCSDLAPGNYYLMLIDGNNKKLIKIIH